MEQFGSYVRELQTQLQAVRAEQEADRRQLLEVRTLLQQSHHLLDTRVVRLVWGDPWVGCGGGGDIIGRVMGKV